MGYTFLKCNIFLCCIVLAATFLVASSYKVNAQSKYDFACVCDYVVNDSCDICDDYVMSRSFSGLMITLDSVVHALIDAPYVVIQREGDILEFKEIGVGEERFIVQIGSTNYFTMNGFRDSTNCNCKASITLNCDSTNFYILSDTLFLQICDTTFSVALPNQSSACDSLSLFVLSDTLYMTICDTTMYVKLPPTGVTSVGLDMPSSEFNVSGSPVTTYGTLTASWKNQAANFVFAGPTNGAPSVPTFRSLVADDIPGQLLPPGSLNQTLRYDGSAWTANSTIRIDGSNRVGIGTAAPITGRTLNYQNNAGENLRFTTTTNAVSGVYNAFEKLTTMTPTSNSSAVIRGLSSEITGDALSGNILQIESANYISVGKNGAVTNIFGLSGSAVAESGASSSNLNALIGNASVNAGTVQNASSVIGVSAMNGTGTVNSSNGLYTYMAGSGTGTLTNRRGLWIRQQIGSLNNNIINHWGIYVSSLDRGAYIRSIETEGLGKMRHWDRVTIGNNNTHPSQLYVRSDGNTSSSYGLIVTNSNASTSTATIAVRDDGNVGIGTNAPTNTLHVVGTERITGSGGTATTITGRDATSVITNVNVGSGLTLTSGTLNASDSDPTNEIQTISATGAGPSSYNIELSAGGGAVTLSEGAGVDLTRSGNIITVAATNNGTVTSVGLSLPSSEFNVSGSPVTTSGTLTGTWKTQSANRVFAGPASGSPAVPTFRALTTNDLPAGVGTVTSVGLGLPSSVFSVSGSPVTSSGTLNGSFINQSANTFFAGPSSGPPSVPSFRTIQASDLPASVTLPPGSVDQSLRHNGSSWVANSLLRIGTNAISVNTPITASSISSSNTITTPTGLNRGHNFTGTYQPSSSSTGSYSTGYFYAIKNNTNNYNNLYGLESIAINQSGSAGNMVAGVSSNVQRTGGSAGRFYGFSGTYLGSGGENVSEAGGAYVKLESSATNLISAFGYRYAGTAMSSSIATTAIGFSSEQASSNVSEHIDFYSSPIALSSNSWGFRGDNTEVKNKFAGNTIFGNTSTTNGKVFIRGDDAFASNYSLIVTNSSAVTSTASLSINNNRETGFGSTPISGFRIYSNGPTRTDGTSVVRGSGSKSSLFSTLNNAAIRLWNTSGQTWYLHSSDSSHFELYNQSLDVNRPSMKVDANSGFAISRGFEVHRQTMTVSYYSGAGTGASTVVLVGGPSAMRFVFTTGTSPSANQPIFQISFTGNHKNHPIVSLTAANTQTATDISKFYVSSTGSNNFTIRANGTLSSSTEYAFHILTIGQ